VIASGRELVNAQVALLERFIAVALEHQGGSSPDVDLGYHLATASHFITSGVATIYPIDSHLGVAGDGQDNKGGMASRAIKEP
jgi:hypothetical protein